MAKTTMMSKDDFVKALEEVGFKAVNENGIIYVTAKKEKYEETKEAVRALAGEKQYNQSYGVKMTA